MVGDKRDGIMTLAIETAIAGGSISVVRDGSAFKGTAGSESVSRAEDLLQGVDRLLTEAGVGKSELGCIAVSTGPGSFTGLRIGISTAMGLANALGIECSGVSLFDAIAARYDTKLAVAVPLGRSDICYRFFENGVANGNFGVGDWSDLSSFIRQHRPVQLAHHPDLDASRLRALELGGASLIDLGSNLAGYVGEYASTTASSGSLEPIYVRNPRFA